MRPSARRRPTRSSARRSTSSPRPEAGCDAARGRTGCRVRRPRHVRDAHVVDGSSRCPARRSPRCPSGNPVNVSWTSAAAVRRMSAHASRSRRTPAPTPRDSGPERPLEARAGVSAGLAPAVRRGPPTALAPDGYVAAQVFRRCDGPVHAAASRCVLSAGAAVELALADAGGHEPDLGTEAGAPAAPGPSASAKRPVPTVDCRWPCSRPRGRSTTRRIRGTGPVRPPPGSGHRAGRAPRSAGDHAAPPAATG